MSRIGKRPVAIPSGVSVAAADGQLRVKGPKGELAERLPGTIRVEVAEGEVRLLREDERKVTRALHGLARALVANMVTGVTEGFARELEIHGVGYRAEVAGERLKMSLGFSHPVEMEVPRDLAVTVRDNRIRIEGTSREAVGQFAANVRAVRPPEPYKGKGIRYSDERVRRKVGKAGGA